MKITITRREELQANFDLKNDRANILFCWLLMWCGTFESQQNTEKEFLVLQAIQVINKMCQNQDNDLMTYILLMLQVVFKSAKPSYLSFLCELWMYDLQLPTSQAFEYYNFKANERRTTFNAAHAAFRKAQWKEKKSKDDEFDAENEVKVDPVAVRNQYNEESVEEL